MRTVTLKRKGKFIVIDPHGNLPNVFYGEFRFFDAICTWAQAVVRRPLTESQSVNVQAMLGSNSIEWMKLGPGAQMEYRLKGN